MHKRLIKLKQLYVYQLIFSVLIFNKTLSWQQYHDRLNWWRTTTHKYRVAALLNNIQVAENYGIRVVVVIISLWIETQSPTNIEALLRELGCAHNSTNIELLLLELGCALTSTNECRIYVDIMTGENCY